MTDNVVDLESRRPHASGPARCNFCGYEWTAIAPIPLKMDAGFECPNCSRMGGYWIYDLKLPESIRIMECNCGSQLFNVLENGFAFCIVCGEQHDTGELID